MRVRGGTLLGAIVALAAGCGGNGSPSGPSGGLTTTTFPGEAPELSTGTYTLTGSRLTMTADQGSGSDVTMFDVALNNGTLVLTGAIVEFDFGTGAEDARLDVTLVH